MTIDDSNWSYSEFLAFLMVYGAQMNYTLSAEELEFIKQKTGIQDIGKIKAKVDSLNDVQAVEVIDDYKKKYLSTPESTAKAKRDLEALLKTPGTHSQLEKAAVHLLEKLI
jgi:ribosomal protein L12E/L44/L45/RPP1/RPP2